jgi:hypothetical protein
MIAEPGVKAGFEITNASLAAVDRSSRNRIYYFN